MGRNWVAKWIWEKKEKDNDKQRFAYFRNTFVIDRMPEKAMLYCCADSKYRLWVNGHYVSFGPARYHPSTPYYDSHDIKKHLRRGKNCVAFLVNYYAKVSIFASVRPGMICEVEMDGKIIISSGRTWKTKTADAYILDKMKYQHPFIFGLEVFDANREPADWTEVNFNDTGWKNAYELDSKKLLPWKKLEPRPIPQIPEKEYLPVKIIGIGICEDKEVRDLSKNFSIAKSIWRSEHKPVKRKICVSGVKIHDRYDGKTIKMIIPKKEQAMYLYLDFGENLLATPEVDVHSSGGILDMGYSEVLENDKVATMRQGICHAERIILKKGRTFHRMNLPRGFRYMVLRIGNTNSPVRINRICAYQVVYPVTQKGDFRCSDDLLNKIYEISKRTLNLCMEDGFTDCPWRERSQWLGDFQPEALINYYCFGAYDLARKAVSEFAMGNQDGEDWIPGVSPVTRPFNLPTWGMRFPVIAWEYYMFTGDKSLLRQSYEMSKRQLRWLEKYEDDAGLVYAEGWNFVDWTRVDDRHAEGAVQGWYLEAIESFVNIAKECGERKQAECFIKKANKLRTAIAKHFWSDKRKAFLKYRHDSKIRPEYVLPDLIGQHENFSFVRLKVGTDKMRKSALESIAGLTGRYLPNIGNYQSAFMENTKGNVRSEDTLYIGSPFWSFYALLCLFENKKEKEGLEYIRLCWGIMLEHGATTCWEMWDRNTSCCHGWSAAPGMVLPAYILGVKPVKPGFGEFEIKPNILGLQWAKGRVPTPDGSIKVEWKMRGDEFTAKVEIPKNKSGIFVFPRKFKEYGKITVDGKRIFSRRISLSEGVKHTIRINIL